MGGCPGLVSDTLGAANEAAIMNFLTVAPRFMTFRSALAFIVAAFLLLPANAQQRSSGPPNIVLIMVDDLGYGDLSSYGADALQTPHIDSLVAAGMRFDRFYANSPECRASFGRMPATVGGT